MPNPKEIPTFDDCYEAVDQELRMLIEEQISTMYVTRELYLDALNAATPDEAPDDVYEA